MKKLILPLLIIFSLTVLITLLIIYNIQSSKNRNPSSSIKPSENIVYHPENISLEKIFSDDHGWTATLSAEKTITLIATGDIIPARSVNHQSLKNNDFTWAYKNIYAFLKNADVTLVNLEAPLIKNCPATVEGMVFCGDERNIVGLTLSGVDVANLANNHLENHGKEGVDNTVRLLNDNGIISSGVNDPVYITVKGIKIAYLGFDDVGPNSGYINKADPEIITSKIREAENNADIIIVSYHWGNEYVAQPTKRQKYLGRLAIDAGADLIIGNHPHWIQPVEIYRDKLIVYAHGNFIFDQMWSEETKKGVAGKYIFYGNKLIDAEYFPVYIRNYGQAEFPDDEKGLEIIEGMKKESEKLDQDR